MVHRLPRARLVDRTSWLVEQCRGRRVIHVGFGDTGFRDTQRRSGRWLHAHLAGAASHLVGIDYDAASVHAARAEGYEAHLVDCTDVRAVAAAGLAPADVVLAGEVIEHVDAPGAFLQGLHTLCRGSGRLIVTTPNPGGLVNLAASLVRGVEVNHPDHVVMFTWRTLTELMRRHGWEAIETAVYVPSLRPGRRFAIDRIGVQAVLGLERLLARAGRPFIADGLIVIAVRQPAASSPGS